MVQNEVTAGSTRYQIRLSVRRFFRWWFTELTALLPSGLHRLMRQQDERLVMDMNDHRILLTQCQDGEGRELGEFPLDLHGHLSDSGQGVLLSTQNKAAKELVIRLSRAQFMTSTLTLSSKTEENLREVLGYEMDQATPFRAEQVYYDYQIVKRLPQQKIEVKLVFVPRARVDQLVQRVREWGGRPAVVTVAEERGENGGRCHLSGLNLLPTEQRQTNGGSRSIPNRLLSASAVMLVLIALLLPIFWQKVTINELEQRIATVKEEAEVVHSMQQKIDTLRSESELILEKKQQYPPVIEILNELTRLLPDDTWLERFNMKGAHLNIHGFTADASALIELIENSSLFRDVAFDSPIVKDPQTNRYRFQIGADLSVGDS